ncbi:AbrB/MazE/SpoVT family DNA-binding domain-containing protein [Rickettsia endosymbiont of Halotydeus destructor]|uniref:AbrB/MazE/SpoVT family DNA-binding domain-containing protein n=1 Tax=Rickettsia endosymbiont of Halotydeus destructor TaxID=2996754 RepID=UPI003BAF2BB0
MICRAKLAKGGKVSIPSLCRKYLNLKDGEEIIFTLKEGEVIISPLRFILKKARNTVNKYHPSEESLVDKLIEQRRKEAKDE